MFLLWARGSLFSSMTDLLLLLLFSSLLLRSEAISFDLEPDSKKCLREEVHKDVLVVGEYELEHSYVQRTDVEVTDCCMTIMLTLLLDLINISCLCIINVCMYVCV